MPRFSEKAMEVFDTIWYNADIKKAKMLIEQLDNPVDIVLGKLLSSFYFLNFFVLNESITLLIEIEKIIKNEDIKDQFVLYLFHSLSFYYYSGWEGPSIDKDLSEQHLNDTKQIFQYFEAADDWERNFIDGWHFKTLAFYEFKNNELHEATKFQRMCLEAWIKISDSDNDFAAIAYNLLGFFLRVIGEFEEAEITLLEALETNQKYNSLWQFTPLINLAAMNATKGDLQKAMEYCNRLLNITKKYENEAGGFIRMGWALDMKASYLYAKGYYNEAKKLRQEVLQYFKRTNEPWRIFNGYYAIVEFYNNRYIETDDDIMLHQAEMAYQDLRKFSSAYPNNKNMINFVELAHALILKHGNIRKKAKAIDILEEQSENYPLNIAISFRLLELLFEDAVLTGDQQTIKQIDVLIARISIIPLRNNPLAVFSYVSQKIMVAKYNYYIKGDISSAIEILNSTKIHIEKYKLSNLSSYIEKELGILEKEITKWDNVNISVKERIKKSKFNKYVQEALKYTESQM